MGALAAIGIGAFAQVENAGAATATRKKKPNGPA